MGNKIQIPVQGAIEKNAYHPRAKCYVKSTWTGTWEHVPYLEALIAVDNISPSKNVARLRYWHGVNMWESNDDYTIYRPKDLIDKYIKIEFDGMKKGAGVWHGIIVDDNRQPEGTDEDPSGPQIMTAYGLEHLLDKKPVTDAWVNESGSIFQIERANKFNFRHGFGQRQLGNRSTSAATGQGKGTTCQHFSSDGDVWTHEDIVRYILEYYQPEGFSGEFKLAGNYDYLSTLKSVVEYDGLTVKQIFDKLIARENGLQWACRAGSGNAIEIVVDSVLGKNIRVGDKELPANSKIHEIIDFGNDILIQEPSVLRSSQLKYDEVRVEGGFIKSAGTVSFNDNTLEKGWTDDEQTEYEDELSEIERQTDQRTIYGKDPKTAAANELYAITRVFQHYRIPRDWDWKTGNGLGGPNEDDGAEKHNVVPELNDNGELVLNSDGTDIKSPNSGGSDASWMWGKGFLRKLPFLNETEKAGAEPEYRDPIVIIRDPAKSNRFKFFDTDHLTTASVRMCDRELAMDLKMGVPHRMALNHFDPDETAPVSIDKPVVDYETIIATVFIESDERLKVVAPVGSEPSEVKRVKIIRIPDAEFWYVVPNTVIDIRDEAKAGNIVPDHDYGQLVHFKPFYTFNAGASITENRMTMYRAHIIRDDSERLREIAAFAKAWYEQKKAAVTFAKAYLTYFDFLGSYIGRIKTGNQVIDSNAIVSQVTWNFENGHTTIETDFVELDFSQVIEVPEMSDLRAVSKKYQAMQARIEEIASHVGKIPVKFPLYPPQGVVDHKHQHRCAVDQSTFMTRFEDGKQGQYSDHFAVRAIPHVMAEFDKDQYFNKYVYWGDDATGLSTTDAEYRIMWRVNESFVPLGGRSSYISANASGGNAALAREGGWMHVVNPSPLDIFEPDDLAVRPKKVFQIGDIIYADSTNLKAVTIDNDQVLVASIRWDSQFFLTKNHDGPIWFTTRDISGAVEGTGEWIKGEMAFDTSLQESSGGHKEYNAGVFRPSFRWPSEYGGTTSSITIQAGDEITINAYGLVTDYTIYVP